MITTINKQDGFSLLEVLIALVILAIGLLAVAQMQITAIKGNAFGSGMTSASSLAANTLERLMALPYDDVQLTTYGNWLPDNITGVEGGVNNAGYVREYQVEDNTPPRLGIQMKQITVRVVWTDSNGRPRNVTMVTQKTQ